MNLENVEGDRMHGWEVIHTQKDITFGKWFSSGAGAGDSLYGVDSALAFKVA